MRFLAAQFEALLADDLWLRCAAHANAMAPALAAALRDCRALTVHAPGAGQRRVRAAAGRRSRAALQEQLRFYVWDEHTGEVRWMCSWDTTEEDVDAFAAAVREALG